jgi:hypothetical protein
MAVLCLVSVPGGSHADAVTLEQRVGERLEGLGGPPQGLMFLAVHPSEVGFTISMVFRNEDLAHAEVNAVREDAAAIDLRIAEPSILPIWSMALPGVT